MCFTCILSQMHYGLVYYHSIRFLGKKNDCTLQRGAGILSLLQ